VSNDDLKEDNCHPRNPPVTDIRGSILKEKGFQKTPIKVKKCLQKCFCVF